MNQNWNQLNAIFGKAAFSQASDIHVAAGQAAWLRVAGKIAPLETKVTEADLESWLKAVGTAEQWQQLQQTGSCDGAHSISSEGADHETRFRFNAFKRDGSLAIAFRRLDDCFHELEALGLPAELKNICDLKDGLILVAGPTGSGKTTTLASLIHGINCKRACHIVTIEDPIEFKHENRQSLITQRQVGPDTESFSRALRDAVRQDPDVILVGEMRDLDTIQTAVMAAETGHLVFATVHAGDCVSAIDRIVGVFPGNEQAMIRKLLANCLRTVIAQHLLPCEIPVVAASGRPVDDRSSRNRVLASEVLHVNSAASNLIANDNLTQLNSILETNRNEGMYTLDISLAKLMRQRKISEATAATLARNPKMLRELSRTV